MKRRNFLKAALGVSAWSAMPQLAHADTYPSRPVRVLVGTAAGGGMDFAGRVIAAALTERLGQQFFVEDRPGAGTNLATEFVIRSAPDGYTLLLVSAANAINATLYKNLKFNFIRDTAPIATVARAPQVMEVHPSVPARTVPEFIAYVKANPHKINMASAGNGSVQQIAGELFKMMTGVDMVHIPYKGAGPALVDLLAGQMQVMFDTTPGSIGHIRSGRLRALAVTTKSRIDLLPDVPPIADFVPGYEATQWYGLVAPKGTPAAVVDKLNQAVNAALAAPAMKGRLGDFGGVAFSSSPRDFGEFIVSETDKFAKVVRFSGATVD